MKRNLIALTALVSSLFAIPTLADDSKKTPLLKEGTSSSQIISNGNPKRYEVLIEEPTTLTVESEHFPSNNSRGNLLEATLYDSSGISVAESSDRNGHFTLERTLDPGTYGLVIDGSSLRSGRENQNTYKLHVSYK